MPDVAAVQRALLARGYDLGPSGADGIWGGMSRKAARLCQIAEGMKVKDGSLTGELAAFLVVAPPLVTVALLRRIAPKAKDSIIVPLAPLLKAYCPAYGVTTKRRLIHFLSQAAHESDGFATLQEYASGAGYEGRKDLGNTQPGDGRRYKGRGIFQLTGRANYREYGRLIGVDLESEPLRAAEPAVSARTALEYWKKKGLNAKADRDDLLGITKAINGGTNGLADRRARFASAAAALAGLPDVLAA